ncbi:MAG: ATP-binding protein [Chloroherpetonaceae bacterium]|nr:ATP-binding protein [Chthonomonadaceae bacterium]MDW8209053.1 ATP-binding protein [Chloroherpetonaceae bacterium]
MRTPSRRRIDVAEYTGPKLDAKNTDRLFDVVHSWIQAGSPVEDVQFDLSHIQFISASGLAWTWTILSTLRERGISVRLSVPQAPSVCQWLETMKLFHHCATHDIPVLDYHPGTGRLTDPEEALLPLTTIEASQDVHQVVTTIIDRLGCIFESHLGYRPRDLHNVSSAISEACLNICEHSNSRGVVAAQRHTSCLGTPFVVIGVADAGQGIRSSLTLAYPEARSWSDEQAIHYAMQEGISGKSREDRGYGLPRIRSIVQTYNGRLQIRSGKTRVSLVGDIQAADSHAFPGTQLCISVSQRS